MDFEQRQDELQKRCREIDERVNQLDEGARKQFQTAIDALKKLSNQLRIKKEAMGELHISSERPHHQRVVKERNKEYFFVCLSSVFLFAVLRYADGFWGSLTFEQASAVAVLFCIVAINHTYRGAKIELLSLGLSRFEMQDQIDSLKLQARRIGNTDAGELDFDAYKAESAWIEAITKSRDDGPLYQLIVNETFLGKYLDLKERLLKEFFEK
jgi:hypothetical protein